MTGRKSFHRGGSRDVTLFTGEVELPTLRTPLLLPPSCQDGFNCQGRRRRPELTFPKSPSEWECGEDLLRATDPRPQEQPGTPAGFPEFRPTCWERFGSFRERTQSVWNAEGITG